MYWEFPMMLMKHSVNSDWLFNTLSRVLIADWLMLENNEKATLNINIHIPRHTHNTSYLARASPNAASSRSILRLRYDITRAAPPPSIPFRTCRHKANNHIAILATIKVFGVLPAH